MDCIWKEWEVIMRERLIQFDVFYFMMALTVVSIVAKGIGVLLYRYLIRESGQMAATKNYWLKGMMIKFEAYYKLRISVHNVENFVERYLYGYRFLGISLIGWENVGYYGAAAMLSTGVLAAFAAAYYGLALQWYLLLGFTASTLLMLHGIAELLLHSHRHRRIFRIQLIDYMENTMRARLENEYFHQEESRRYQMEYFQEKGQEEPEENENQGEEAVSPDSGIAAPRKEPAMLEGSRDMKELLASLLEEIQIDREIRQRQSRLEEQDNASQRARLFEEVLKEYM